MSAAGSFGALLRMASISFSISAKDSHLFQKSHIHRDTAFDVNFLIERVEVAAHLFVIVCVVKGAVVGDVGTSDAGDFLYVSEDLDAAFF